MTHRPVIYFSKPKQADRWLRGDRELINYLKKIFGKNQRQGSIEQVFLNLLKGLDKIGAPYAANLPFGQLQSNDVPVMLGQGMDILKSYTGNIPVIAGIGLMTHPAQVPGLFSDYPVKLYLQHSEWTRAIYERYYGTDRIKIWPAGIDTDLWHPSKNKKRSNILVYHKVLWPDREEVYSLLPHIVMRLQAIGIPYRVIRYGSYTPAEYHDLLDTSKAMIFLCEHESQGMACGEAMAMNVPVFAWNQGRWLDPNRFTWNEQDPVPASSVPYFDRKCGLTFTNRVEFDEKFQQFINKTEKDEFSPREYILENLTLKKSAQKLLAIIKETYS